MDKTNLEARSAKGIIGILIENLEIIWTPEKGREDFTSIAESLGSNEEVILHLVKFSESEALAKMYSNREDFLMTMTEQNGYGVDMEITRRIMTGEETRFMMELATYLAE